MIYSRVCAAFAMAGLLGRAGSNIREAATCKASTPSGHAAVAVLAELAKRKPRNCAALSCPEGLLTAA